MRREFCFLLGGFSLALLYVGVSAQAAENQDPSDFCQQCRNRRNQKDHYADPNDCHYFFQCFFYNETYAVGIRRPCPPLTFWHDEILQCLPEGNIPCQDICRDEAVSTAGCYGIVGSCNQYFVCANTASYPFCCPLGSSFNASICSCDTDATCLDICIQPPRPVTTEKSPTQIDSTDCRDSYGSTLRVVPGHAESYYIVDTVNNFVSDPRPCAPGTLFDVGVCRCDVLTEVTLVNKDQCNLFMPMVEDFSDHSVYRYTTFLYGDGGLDDTTGSHGSSSFRFNGGRIEVPGLKTFDFDKSASYCLFFNGLNGGLFSNNNDSTLIEYSVVIGLQNSALSSLLQFWHPNGQQTVSYQNAVNAGWNQVCLTYDGQFVKLYVNMQLVDSEPASGEIKVGHCPYTIGSDQFLGDFIGNIDNLLVCPFTFDQNDVNAHYNGDYFYFANNGNIPPYL